MYVGHSNRKELFGGLEYRILNTPFSTTDATESLKITIDVNCFSVIRLFSLQYIERAGISGTIMGHFLSYFFRKLFR